jgi:hypothetical protein
VQALGQLPRDNPAAVASKPTAAIACQLLVIQDIMILSLLSL